MKYSVLKALLFLAGCACQFLVILEVHCDVHDPLDPFDFRIPSESDDVSDDSKSTEELLMEATMLLEDERPLDARTKLLKVLAKDPKEFRAHLLLASYYMTNVGHFRLALRYVKQAQALFEEKHGKPPFFEPRDRSQHGQILYLLSQARLNLDDYQGSLETLNDYQSWGYYSEWYPGSRAWVLMKLGRLKEAIKEARIGVLADVDARRTLNMLGILLSMTGERESAITILKQAIVQELSQGKDGQPATPLNNIGEVYEELFDEEQAISSYRRATQMPDGCEHVLPSLNLALLLLDELNPKAASNVIDNFESCIAQYPLKNGEEHRALVHFARGRIALKTGHEAAAIDHLRSSLESRQWFGKIGTDAEDLQAAALAGLARALTLRNNVLSFTRTASWKEWIVQKEERAENAFNAWWALRRARQMLTEDLNDFEDLLVRNTDSLLEYPTVGELLSGFPLSSVQARLAELRKSDNRGVASTYYLMYEAQWYASHGYAQQARDLLSRVEARTRPRFDNSLLLETLLARLSLTSEEDPNYRVLAERIYSLSPPSLRAHGVRLPVKNGCKDGEMERQLFQTAFQEAASDAAQFAVLCDRTSKGYRFAFSGTAGVAGASIVSPFVAEESELVQAVNNFNDRVFSIALPK